MANQPPQKRVLGKGLSAIISSSSTPAAAFEQSVVRDSSRVVELDVNKISPNPDQPRLHFNEDEIKGLAESIQSVGLIQPIIVRQDGAVYYIVAGERRLRAVKLSGASKIKAIIIEANEEQNFSLALIENLQRSNLDPIEEAKAYQLLINRFKLKQQDVAARVGKERATVANSLRLLNLPAQIQEALSEGKISSGHAKVLLSLSPNTQNDFYHQVLDKGLSVRALEQLISGEDTGQMDTAPSKKKKQPVHADPHIRKMEEKLKLKLGTKVEIKHLDRNKGRIEISYYSLDDFERIVEMFRD